MNSNSKQLALWKLVLNAELGPRWRKHLTHIAVTLECVTKGLKPAFLWDSGPNITPAHLFHVLRALKAKELVSKDLHVLTIAGDALIVNLIAFRQMMEEFGSRKRAFVDITAREPRIVEPGTATDGKCRAMLASVSEAVATLGLNETKRTESAALPLQDDWCVPSLFGMLSGYPYVYWYDTTVFEESHMLDGLPLQVYRTHAKTRRGEFELYSFTVPCSVMNEVGARQRVDAWFERMTERFRGHAWLLALGVKGGRVVLPRVML